MAGDASRGFHKITVSVCVCVRASESCDGLAKGMQRKAKERSASE